MWSIFKFTVAVLLSSSLFFYCHGKGVESIKDFNGMNSNFSNFSAKKYDMVYFDMGPGLEQLYFRNCSSNGYWCEKEEHCISFGREDAFKNPTVCMRRCQMDSECENDQCDYRLCRWKKCRGYDDCKLPWVCATAPNIFYGGFCVRMCDCGDKGICRFEKSQKKCYCNPGYVENDGKCKACDCGKTGTCRIEKCQKICDCDPGFIENDGKCIACNCGIKGTCRYEKGQKVCQCDPGFADDNGICTECDCGVDSDCNFEGPKYKGLHKKVCHCKPLYKEENGTCVGCICRGGKCIMEEGKIVCKCPPGYGNFTTDSCKACDCGPDTNCIWEARFGGNKICLCKPGYSTKKGKCVACECGADSNCEWISEGWLKPEKKVCHCKPGYHQEKEICVDKQDRKSL